MLDANDLQAIKSLMDESITASEKRMRSHLNKSIDARIKKSENMVLNQLDTVQEHLEMRIDKLEAKVDQLNTKVDDLGAKVEQIQCVQIPNLEKRVTRLEERAS